MMTLANLILLVYVLLSFDKEGFASICDSMKFFQIDAFIYHCWLRCLFSYDPKEDKWNVLAEMNTARALAGCTVFKQKIYVVGMC